ncbi:MAG TPA: ABC transporter ATP-binding protein [Candidatus Saccharimonadales bacterium]|nr:ABC transporter ATP-binding protein [Candidatus Saccharimonadales bacterium]
MDKDAAIKVEGISKTFKLPHEKHSSVKSLFVNFYRSKRTYELQQALRNISFEVKKGEFFGIVGRNGSGKSTLLKLIAGIYAPTKGNIIINGSLTPFIELGVGFNPELSGRENVYLNGALLGFNRRQMRAMYSDIVKFAELEKFMDQKLKNYSSGMQVRLAFSIAIRAHSEILLLDEVLAVGDAAFQQKCYDYFSKLKADKKTIVLVSHNMPIVEKYCDRALLLESGEIMKIGQSNEVAGLYENMFIREEADRVREERIEQNKAAENTGPIKIQGVKIVQGGKVTKHIQAKKDFEVHIALDTEEDYEKANVGLNIKNHDRIMLVSTDTFESLGGIKLKKGKSTSVTFKIENILTDGVYTVNIGIADYGLVVAKILLRQEHIQEFSVFGVGPHAKSLTHPRVKVKVDQVVKASAA